MKFKFALVTLLHLVQVLVQCRSIDHHHVVPELINRLKDLGKNKINTTSTIFEVPTDRMQSNSECCLSVFKKKLLEVVNNVTVPEIKKHYIDEIKGLLILLQANNEDNEKCKVKKRPGMPFKPYIIYLQKFNERRKRSLENKSDV